MLNKILLGVEALLSVIALVFFSASIGASSFHFEALKNSNWVTIDQGSTHGYVGFRAIAAETTFSGTTFTGVTHITNCGGDDDVCTSCGDEGGRASLALLAIALGFSALGLVATLARLMDPGNMTYKGGQLGLMFICFVFGIAAFANYTKCYNELVDQINDDDVKYGPGFALCVVGAFLVFIAFCMGFISCGDDAHNTPPPAANPVANHPAPVPTNEGAAEKA